MADFVGSPYLNVEHCFDRSAKVAGDTGNEVKRSHHQDDVII